MKISTRARYGIRALLDLALNDDKERVLLKDIAQRQEISLPYLEHLITPLITKGIVRSARGSRGGISLRRRPEEIRLNEVVEILEGSIAPVECVDDPKICPRSETCVTRDLWDEMKRAMNDILNITLQDLVDKQKKREKGINLN
jgi:Rrf2 family protein